MRWNESTAPAGLRSGRTGGRRRRDSRTGRPRAGRRLPRFSISAWTTVERMTVQAAGRRVGPGGSIPKAPARGCRARPAAATTPSVTGSAAASTDGASEAGAAPRAAADRVFGGSAAGRSAGTRTEATAAMASALAVSMPLAPGRGGAATASACATSIRARSGAGGGLVGGPPPRGGWRSGSCSPPEPSSASATNVSGVAARWLRPHGGAAARRAPAARAHASRADVTGLTPCSAGAPGQLGIAPARQVAGGDHRSPPDRPGRGRAPAFGQIGVRIGTMAVRCQRGQHDRLPPGCGHRDAGMRIGTDRRLPASARGRAAARRPRPRSPAEPWSRPAAPAAPRCRPSRHPRRPAPPRPREASTCVGTASRGSAPASAGRSAVANGSAGTLRSIDRASGGCGFGRGAAGGSHWRRARRRSPPRREAPPPCPFFAKTGRQRERQVHERSARGASRGSALVRSLPSPWGRAGRAAAPAPRFRPRWHRAVSSAATARSTGMRRLRSVNGGMTSPCPTPAGRSAGSADGSAAWGVSG